jgi:hypothetical protein
MRRCPRFDHVDIHRFEDEAFARAVKPATRNDREQVMAEIPPSPLVGPSPWICS